MRVSIYSDMNVITAATESWKLNATHLHILRNTPWKRVSVFPLPCDSWSALYRGVDTASRGAGVVRVHSHIGHNTGMSLKLRDFLYNTVHLVRT